MSIQVGWKDIKRAQKAKRFLDLTAGAVILIRRGSLDECVEETGCDPRTLQRKLFRGGRDDLAAKIKEMRK